MTDRRPRALILTGHVTGELLAFPHHVRALLGEYELDAAPVWAMPRADQFYIWGVRRWHGSARMLARARGAPIGALEDGFLRSLDLGRAGDPPLSLTVDRQRPYFDGRGPSDLENMLAEPGHLPAAALSEADDLIALIRSKGLTKYNHLPRIGGDPADALVIDQSYGDWSVRCGGAGPDTFVRMLDAALARHANVRVRTHPDTVAGKRGSYYDASVEGRGAVLEPAVQNLPDRLANVETVYTVTSQVGFEALIHGKRVVTFGQPFYAGWGLTEDHAALQRRPRTRTLTELVAAALVLYPRYVDPETLAPVGALTFVERLAAARDKRAVARLP